MQCKIYDEEKCVDLNNQPNNNVLNNSIVKGLLDKGYSWSEMWLLFGQRIYPYDENFIAVSNYAFDNKILSKDETLIRKPHF